MNLNNSFYSISFFLLFCVDCVLNPIWSMVNFLRTEYTSSFIRHLLESCKKMCKLVLNCIEMEEVEETRCIGQTDTWYKQNVVIYSKNRLKQLNTKWTERKMGESASRIQSKYKRQRNRRIESENAKTRCMVRCISRHTMKNMQLKFVSAVKLR